MNGKEKRRAKEEAREAARKERAENFARQSEQLCAQGFAACDKTLSVRSAQRLGFLCSVPFAAAAIVGFVFVPNKVFLLTGNFFADIALFFFLVAASIPVHEGLHALGWAAANGSFRGLRFGVAEGSPYCACTRPMRRWKYLAGLLAPFVLLGAGLSAAGLGARSLLLLAGGVFNIVCAGGDLLVAFRAFGSRGLLLDHPERCGFVLFCEPTEKGADEAEK